jgi:hypothetical protein
MKIPVYNTSESNKNAEAPRTSSSRLHFLTPEPPRRVYDTDHGLGLEDVQGGGPVVSHSSVTENTRAAYKS